MRSLLIEYLRPYRRQLVLVVGLLLVQSIASLSLPTLNAHIINDGVAKGDTRVIVSLGTLMLAVTLVMGVASVVAVYWSAKTAMGLGRDVRARHDQIVRSQIARYRGTEIKTMGDGSLATFDGPARGVRCAGLRRGRDGAPGDRGPRGPSHR